MAGINCSIVPCSALMEGKEFNFSNLYLHHTYGGPKPNQSTIINNNGSTGLGMTAVNNWAVLKGSTLQVMGVPVECGEWAIVGGTGEFIMASGVIYKKVHERRSEGNIIELTIHGFCPSLKGTKCLPTKVGPWGGNGGTPQDITETPKRLESITIRSGEVVDSISFSYFDQAGQKRVAGPWGGPGGNLNTIELSSSEFLKEVSGTFGTYYGSNVITFIKFVTNVKTYGPFGKQNGTPFISPCRTTAVL
ncbi:Os12g0228700 [Oryza sativa Japonica Group]|uniref:Dirigent protein n=1 Tax=Oryza sativa subsp. japonica TaxID=39947 RepID=Q0IPA7_ORYSJ|nr:Os12g0228700 [Oryza sativa Japonica Group]|eukprot:NP_001066439.2 Os12g0228700 [Oryza sativa Japonica Group]